MTGKKNEVVLRNIQYNGRRCTMMAALQSTLRALGVDVEPHKLYGLTGHGFVTSVSRGVTELGTLGFCWPHVLGLGQSLGYRVATVSAGRADGDMREILRQAWQLITTDIDRGCPLIAFGIHAPEFYVIYGYRPIPEGIYFLGYRSDRARQPSSYTLLGETRPGVLFAAGVEPGQPGDERTSVRGAMEFAVGFFESGGVGSEDFDSPRWGRAAYDVWIEALESSPLMTKLSAPGIAHNAALWSECKENAGRFLEWAFTRFSGAAGDALAEAAEEYAAASIQLGYLERLLPEDAGDMANDPNVRREGAHLVGRALEAESRGIESIKRFLDTS